MPDSSRKIEVGENHRRAISVLMRAIESATGDVVEWLTRSSTTLTEVRADLTPDQQARLRDLVVQVNAEVQRLEARIVLDKKRLSRRRSVAALASSALIDIQEVQASGLRGYGRLVEEAKPVLDDSLRRMALLLGQMLHIVENE
jgi:Ni,Fe-hydrogenase III large subunit